MDVLAAIDNAFYLNSLVVSLLSRVPKMLCKIAILYYLQEVASQATRRLVQEGYWVDGRGVADVRPIWSRAVCLPRVHGSAPFKAFYQGGTQALKSRP